jgi:hypothetical protein
MTETESRWPLTAESQVTFQVSPHGFCVDEMAAGQDLLHHFGYSLLVRFHQCFVFIFILTLVL